MVSAALVSNVSCRLLFRGGRSVVLFASFQLFFATVSRLAVHCVSVVCSLQLGPRRQLQKYWL